MVNALVSHLTGRPRLPGWSWRIMTAFCAISKQKYSKKLQRREVFLACESATKHVLTMLLTCVDKQIWLINATVLRNQLINKFSNVELQILFRLSMDVRLDVPYTAPPAHPLLTFDLYSNPQLHPPQPLICFVHGGAWREYVLADQCRLIVLWLMPPQRR